MNLDKLPHWLQSAVASLGGGGLLLVAFLDSSVFTFPVINDLLVIQLSIRSPAKMPYYALMATLGSLGGCVFLYFLARKGGEIAFRKHAGARAEHIRAWVRRNGFLTILIAALMPPPIPLKPFVLAAGVFQEPLKSFALALFLARSLRYFVVGFLAVRYGPEAIRYFGAHKQAVGLVGVALVLAGYLLSRVIIPRPQAKS